MRILIDLLSFLGRNHDTIIIIELTLNLYVLYNSSQTEENINSSACRLKMLKRNVSHLEVNFMGVL